MTQELTTTNGNAPAVANGIVYTREQLDLIKKTVAAGTSDLEFQMFIEIAQSLQLNPLLRQIYAIMRNEKQADGSFKKKMTIQTGVDGLRLIAHRTGALAGIDEAEYDNEDADLPKWARVTVWRFVQGQRVPFTAKVKWKEFGNTVQLWVKMPFHMLAKVAESHALRKAFQAETSGIYTHEEMAQAQSDTPIWATPEQAKKLAKACEKLGVAPPTTEEIAQMTYDEAESVGDSLRRQWEARKTVQVVEVTQ